MAREKKSMIGVDPLAWLDKEKESGASEDRTADQKAESTNKKVKKQTKVEYVIVSGHKVDEAALVKDSLQIIVQVNGKLRSRIDVPASADKSAIEQAALEDENVKRFTEGQQVVKVIVVPGKLVNIVVK